jgi:copper transport protein
MIKNEVLFGFSRLIRHKGWRRLVGMLLACWLLAAGLAIPRASAHAVLEKTSPVQDAQLQQSPSEVEIVFNERLETGGETLAVLNEASRNVTVGKPERILGGTGLRIAIPKLSEGHYTVS